MHEVRIQLDNEDQVAIFVKWFEKEGFDNLLRSQINDFSKDSIQCIASSEPEDYRYSHWFELQ
jgi:hypothetical protein